MIGQRNSKRILFRLVDGVQVVEVDHILYVESNDHILTVHMQDGSQLQTRQTLGELLKHLEQLAPSQFVSPIKGYIVNQKKIKCLKRACVEIGNAKIPLARGSFRKFQENYFDYIFSV